MKARGLLTLAVGIGFLFCLVIHVNPAPAAKEEVLNLRVASTWPPGSILVEQAWKPPLEEIKKKSNGRITYTMFPGSILGKPNEQYDMVRIGKADLITDFSVQYTPGRFPMSELLTMPVVYPKHVMGSEVALAVFDRLLNEREYQDTKTFFLYSVPNFNYLGKKKVTSLAEMKGLKLRSSGGFVPKTIGLLGATAVHMPPGDLFLSMQTGVVDGATLGYLAVVQFKLQEVGKYFMLGFSFGSTCNGVAMNKNAWEKVPNDLKPMVSEEIRRMGYLANKVNDDHFESSMKMFASAGLEVYTLPPEEVDRWNKLLKPAVHKWVADLQAKGLPADKALGIYREECQKRGVAFPF